jgi:transcriptional antiterminator Rof (Rho-off)
MKPFVNICCDDYDRIDLTDTHHTHLYILRIHS